MVTISKKKLLLYRGVSILLAAAVVCFVLFITSSRWEKTSPTHLGANTSPTVVVTSYVPVPPTVTISPPQSTTAPVPPTGTVTPTVPAPTVTYTVQPGDNLTIIANWFKLHGYQDLYNANKAVIGSNPNLIRPGQVLVVMQ